MPVIYVPVEQIKKGDEFSMNGIFYWKAVEDAKTVGKAVTLTVRHADGARGERVWDAGSIKLTVWRRHVERSVHPQP